MRKFFLLALLCFIGCEDASKPSSHPFFDQEPKRPSVEPSRKPKKSIEVVMVSEPWCPHCPEQEKILVQMKRDGLIKSYTKVGSNNRNYPARQLPTVYICTPTGCNRIEGVASAQEILKAAN